MSMFKSTKSTYDKSVVFFLFVSFTVFLRSQEVQRMLRSGSDMTLCDCNQQTALHRSPPELLGKVLGWMSRPHLHPQAQLLQAAWQGDLHSLQHLLVRLPHRLITTTRFSNNCVFCLYVVYGNQSDLLIEFQPLH